MNSRTWLIALIHVGTFLWAAACIAIGIGAVVQIAAAGPSVELTQVAAVAGVSAVVGAICGLRLSRCLAKRVDQERRGFSILPPR